MKLYETLTAELPQSIQDGVLRLGYLAISADSVCHETIEK